MEEVIVTSIISGIFVVISSVVTLAVKQRIEDHSKEPISDDDRAALSGRWHVQIAQAEGPSGEPLQQEFDLPLRVKGKKIEGDFVHQSPVSGRGYPSTVTGNLIPNRFVKLEYRAKDAAVLLFGHVLVRLADDPREMNGTFSGFHPGTGKPTHGTVSMKKVA